MKGPVRTCGLEQGSMIRKEKKTNSSLDMPTGRAETCADRGKTPPGRAGNLRWKGGKPTRPGRN